MNSRYAHWMNYLQQFEFVIKNKSRIENKVVDTLSRGPHLLHVFSANSMRFKSLKMQYGNDEDFGNVLNNLYAHARISGGNYSLKDGFIS